MREKNVVMRINKTDISKIKIKREKLLDVHFEKKLVIIKKIKKYKLQI